MEIYLVGGAVRDQLLELPVEERDWLVVGANPQQMRDMGFSQLDTEFPVFIHPETGEEYALARRESKTGPGYKGFSVETGPGVTLLEDLARRDLTINAMALDANENLIDPWNGQEDLDHGLLRHVTEAFQEDPVRVLRVARFAAKLGQWGFRVAHGTHGLMKKMVRTADFSNLSKERFWKEMMTALGYSQPWRFYQVLHRCGALEKLLPQLDRSMGCEAGHGTAQSSLETVLQRAVQQQAAVNVRLLVTLLQAIETKQDLAELEHELPRNRSLLRMLRAALRVKQDYPGLMNAGASDQYDYQQFHSSMNEKEQTQLSQLAKVLYPSLWQETERQLAAVKHAVNTVDVQQFVREGFQGARLGQALRMARIAAIEHGVQQRETGD